MGKAKFFYGCMGGGKTSKMLTMFDSYKRRKKKPVIIKPSLDNREGSFFGWGITKSRIIKDAAPTFYFNDLKDEILKLDFGCLFVDEAQFLQRSDVEFLCELVDERGIDIFFFGLKTDINMNLFEGSAALLAICDEFEEIETLCECDGCNEKAVGHVRFLNGVKQDAGESVAIETGDVTYKSVCRKHWKNYID